eukprot:CAMPEP_0205943742 /NCGR_PEP_ID=MMETSP1325-20131115/61269_1 /ASSEMBLY_ACC=CAM_ASM_000708 /TAXON_ID=236786 /ORGANISM="Florenciella sp., Strain RCC1007" /LENGTH=44 /DNA_ID= /DNA_START= /DNA_END= /DNA_ORIENTATION=
MAEPLAALVATTSSTATPDSSTLPFATDLRVVDEAKIFCISSKL